MNTTKEIFKDIKGYEGRYQVSNLGRVKSLERKCKTKGGALRIVYGRILSFGIDGQGYRIVGICKNGNNKTTKVHHLVWETFGESKRNGIELQVDHIDNDKLNNHIYNLQLLDNRANCSKGWLISGKKTSQFTGVGWHTRNKMWRARIRVDNRQKLLGYFHSEHEAALTYQKVLEGLPDTLEGFPNG